MRTFFCCWLLALSTWCSQYEDLSTFEQQAVDKAMEQFSLTVATQAEGKTIDEIFIYTMSPFSEEAGLFALLNRMHINTQTRVIAKLLSVAPGQKLESALVTESEINLRRGVTRSLVICLPVQRVGSNDSSLVSLLVVTQDAFTLQPGVSFEMSGDTLNNLGFSLSESNLFGLNKHLGVGYDLVQSAHEAHVNYRDRAFLGTNWEFMVAPEIYWQRRTGKVDGWAGVVSLTKPLLSQLDKWGVDMALSYEERSKIDFVGNDVRKVSLGGNEALKVEHRYRWQNPQGGVTVTRSFGREHKFEIFGGPGVTYKNPSVPADLMLDDDQTAAFTTKVLPKKELESYVKLGTKYFQNSFLSIYNYERFVLEETVRLGAGVVLSSDFSKPQFTFGTYGFWRPQTAWSYTQAYGKDAFSSVSIKTSNRYDGSWLDNTYRFTFVTVLPQISQFARVVTNASLSMALDNRDNKKLVVGTQEGLRGVGSRFYRGQIAMRGNAEVRTRALKVWIAHAGLAAFYDVGSAFDSWSKANATHALGFGLRFLLPQISADILRVDLAFPIYGIGRRYHTVVPSFGMGQAF
jgi:hypothetical protein